MATSGRVPTLGFGIATGAVVLLGFGGWGGVSVATGRKPASGHAYATSRVSARAYRAIDALSAGAYSSNIQRGRAHANSMVNADGYPTNRATARALLTE